MSSSYGRLPLRWNSARTALACGAGHTYHFLYSNEKGEAAPKRRPAPVEVAEELGAHCVIVNRATPELKSTATCSLNCPLMTEILGAVL